MYKQDEVGTTVHLDASSRSALRMSAIDGQDATTPRNGAPLLDLGWNEDPEHISTLMEGMSNDYIFMLVRRFNKVNWYLKDSGRLPAGDLDLAVAPEQEFSPNKFRSQLERFYMSVVRGPQRLLGASVLTKRLIDSSPCQLC